MKFKTRDLTITAMFTAIGILIPYIFHSIQLSGQIFLPMHIPVILCAMLCGPFLGSICAIFVVILSSFITGMPPLYPVATIMVFELVAYALVAGIIFKLLEKKANIIFASYISLTIAMVVGRIVLGLASVVFIGLLGNGYTLKAFITAAFVTALPGIIIQLILILFFIFFIKKLIKNYKK